jgi:uncharacterized protein
MNRERLPDFKYFLDSVADGVVQESPNVCRCCERARGYIYVGRASTEDEDFEDAFCPWCIASGEAAAKFGVEFIDRASVGGFLGHWGRVPESVLTELVTRTPGFIGWQGEQWFTHCGDAAMYLGRAGHDELVGAWRAAVPSIRADAGMSEADWDDYVETLSRDGDCTAYVFRCLHCGQLGGYTDCS